MSRDLYEDLKIACEILKLTQDVNGCKDDLKSILRVCFILKTIFIKKGRGFNIFYIAKGYYMKDYTVRLAQKNVARLKK